MALPTAREVWRLALPTATKLLGGESGLAKPTLWARRMSVYPPAFADLEEGEFALLSVDALPLLSVTLAQVVRSLSERRAAALAVTGSVSEEAKAMAGTYGLPLFLLPPGTDLRDVERDIIRLIVERESQLTRRSQQVYHRLAQLSIENHGLSTICQTLCEITGKPTLIQDETLSIEAQAWPENHLLAPDELAPLLEDEAPLSQWLDRQQLNRGAPLCATVSLAPSVSRCMAAIIIEEELAGYLSLLGPPDSFDDLDRLAVERGALVCTAEMAKLRAVEAVEDRLRGELLDLILTAGPTEKRALARRTAEMGYEMEHQHAVVIFGLNENSPQTPAFVAGEFQAHLMGTGISSFLCPYEGDLVALCRAQDLSPLRQLEELVRVTQEGLTQRSPESHVAIGIGRPDRGLEGLRRSFDQAREALALARGLFCGDRVLAFGDLGVYRLLCQLQDSEELAGFYGQTLGSLARYDAAHNTELVSTLEAFFAHHGNVSQAAESLHLHRNSLLYRLERIGEITGLDLSDADDRFSLQLALKIRPLLGEPAS
jgi:purine catabolism regulator